jgi:hypothetical protein
MNLPTLITQVRQDLHDLDAEYYRWSDEELARHLAHAVKDFSFQIPLQSSEELATLPNIRELDISSLEGLIRIEAVEFPQGLFPPLRQRFALWGSTLVFLGPEIPDGANCKIYYTKSHSLDEAGSTIPPQFEDLVVTGACGYAAVALAAYTINQVNVGGVVTPASWSQMGRELLTYFRTEIKRLGYRGKVRVNQLYVPCYPVVSQSTDPGP